MIVVDASAALDLLLNRAPASALRERFFRAGETLHAPHLLDVEVLHVLRRYNLTREMTDDRAEEALRNHLALPIERYSHELLAGRIWQLRRDLTAYDAVYVALAELLGAPLLTTDARLARSSAARKVAELVQ
ncbi:MAG TPA: type II toxin-antitoxin system VapC family toxin [Thermoanaerobaculia bacterium]